MIAIGGALATRYYMQPDELPQFIQEENNFKPVGDFGIDYNCYDSNNVCTFYLPDSVARPKEFLPYRKGQYVPVKK